MNPAGHGDPPIDTLRCTPFQSPLPPLSCSPRGVLDTVPCVTLVASVRADIVPITLPMRFTPPPSLLPYSIPCSCSSLTPSVAAQSTLSLLLPHPRSSLTVLDPFSTPYSCPRPAPTPKPSNPFRRVASPSAPRSSISPPAGSFRWATTSVSRWAVISGMARRTVSRTSGGSVRAC